MALFRNFQGSSLVEIKDKFFQTGSLLAYDEDVLYKHLVESQTSISARFTKIILSFAIASSMSAIAVIVMFHVTQVGITREIAEVVWIFMSSVLGVVFAVQSAADDAAVIRSKAEAKVRAEIQMLIAIGAVPFKTSKTSAFALTPGSFATRACSEAMLSKLVIVEQVNEADPLPEDKGVAYRVVSFSDGSATRITKSDEVEVGVVDWAKVYMPEAALTSAVKAKISLLAKFTQASPSYDFEGKGNTS